MLSCHQYDEPPEYEGISESLFQLYRLRTAQCLIIGDIAKCLPYTIETLRFNATAELNRKDDNSRGLWMMTGVVVRAAINMGYHRDPSQSPSLSILQAEFRRRVWFSIISMDDMASFLVGFPRMTPAIYSDTKEPRNIHDWELSDDTTLLPPARPLTETTSATYLIVKGRLSRALGRVTDFHNTPSQASYETVLDIDRSLYEAHRDFPEQMKVFDTQGNLKLLKSKSDFSHMQLESLYHKGMCILHRRFITKGRLDARFKHSRDRCISSALAILDYQRLLDPSWYKFANTRKLFTLGGMILCLELEHQRRDPNTGVSSNSDGLLQALEKSCALWEAAESSCDEAERIYHVLAGMISSFQTSTGNTASSQTQVADPLFDLAGLSSQLQPTNGSIPSDTDTFFMSDTMDIDWVSLTRVLCRQIISY